MRIRKRLLLSTDHALQEEPNLDKELGNQEEVKMMKEHDDDEYTKRDNHFRVEAILVEQPQASSHQQDRWGENDKVIPLKKRRGNFDQIVVNSHDEEEYHNKSSAKKTMTKKSKLKPKKKMRSKVETSSTINSRKVIMEGSRCSRVNGRGWRCFQQTLIGYSLCEHHLGKGRLFKSVNFLLRDDRTSESDHETDRRKRI